MALSGGRHALSPWKAYFVEFYVRADGFWLFAFYDMVTPSWYCHAHFQGAKLKLRSRAFCWGIVCYSTSSGSFQILTSNIFRIRLLHPVHVWKDPVKTKSRPCQDHDCPDHACQDYFCWDHIWQNHVCQDHVWLAQVCPDHVCPDHIFWTMYVMTVFNTISWSNFSNSYQFWSNFIQFQQTWSHLIKFNQVLSSLAARRV